MTLKIALAGLIVVAALSACSEDAPTGFNDPQKLAEAVKEEINTELAREVALSSSTDIDFVDTIKCIEASERQFTCAAESALGRKISKRVTVTEDGKDWVAG